MGTAARQLHVLTINARPEVFSTKRIDGWDMVWSHVAVVNGR